MSVPEIVNKYRKDVEDLRRRAKKELNLSDERFDEILGDALRECRLKIARERTDAVGRSALALKAFAIFLLVVLIAYILLNVHQTTSSIVLRNVQGLIYPGLKLLRFLSVPVVKRFPSLTYLYDESCLVENPYFYVSDMECWPCENVHSVVDLTGFSNHSLYQSGVPYIVKTKQPQVPYEAIRELLLSNLQVFKTEADSIRSNDPNLRSVKDLLNYKPRTAHKSSDTHISWRINRMLPGRLIRSVFPRPHVVSEWSGQSMERYVMIDEPEAAAYSLPNTECSYVFVVQGSGERTIILKPSRECKRNCRTVSIVLRPSYVLWYNWWYWRPISLPVENSTDTGVTYVSSYC